MRTPLHTQFTKVMWFFKYKTVPTSYLTRNRLIAERSSKDKYIYSIFTSTWNNHSWSISTTKVVPNYIFPTIRYVILIVLLLFALKISAFTYYLAIWGLYLPLLVSYLLTTLILPLLPTHLLPLLPTPSRSQDTFQLQYSPAKIPTQLFRLLEVLANSETSYPQSTSPLLPTPSITYSLLRSTIGEGTGTLSLTTPPHKLLIFQAHSLMMQSQKLYELLRWQSLMFTVSPRINMFLNTNLTLPLRTNPELFLWFNNRLALTTASNMYLTLNIRQNRLCKVTYPLAYTNARILPLLPTPRLLDSNYLLPLPTERVGYSALQTYTQTLLRVTTSNSTINFLRPRLTKKSAHFLNNRNKIVIITS